MVNTAYTTSVITSPIITNIVTHVKMRGGAASCLQRQKNFRGCQNTYRQLNMKSWQLLFSKNIEGQYFINPTPAKRSKSLPV
jgi:hypothetical protein